MSDIEVMAARADECDALANMIQLYTHDFSEQWSGTPRGDLQDDGRFPAYKLDAYWSEADHVPLLFRLGGRLIGFALLNGLSHSGRPVERNMAEFFITRKYRRCGLGSAAAQKIFSCYPGLWEVAVARRNLGALAFWHHAIKTHPFARDVEETDSTSCAWNGPILQFRIGLPAS